MLDIILGSQFGDEGKGRIVDYFCSTGQYDMCARANGSDNAGHTIMLGDNKFSFNQIPIGAAHGMGCIIARGCMVDLEKLDAEIERVEVEMRIHCRPDSWLLYLDNRCCIKDSEHRIRDLDEEHARPNPIGTTLSGNGPAYADKHGRYSQRICDIDISVYPNISRKAIICDTSLLNYDKCLVEGAHGIMLDIDHGTYPFVTSSACTSAALIHSLGISPKMTSRIIGVAKPYITRVGAGAFPTEILGEVTSSMLRERGQEYGTNTKRPRRIGWLDIPALRYAVRVAGMTEIALCKIDVLDVLESIEVCVGYKGEAKHIPAKNEDYAKVNPIYETIKWDKLGLTRLTRIIEELIDIPVTIVTNRESVSLSHLAFKER